MTKAMAGMLFDVSGFDLVTFLAAAGVLGASSFAASLLPSWRASRVDPLVALRHE